MAPPMMAPAKPAANGMAYVAMGDAAGGGLISNAGGSLGGGGASDFVSCFALCFGGSGGGEAAWSCADAVSAGAGTSVAFRSMVGAARLRFSVIEVVLSGACESPQARNPEITQLARVRHVKPEKAAEVQSAPPLPGAARR